MVGGVNKSIFCGIDAERLRSGAAVSDLGVMWGGLPGKEGKGSRGELSRDNEKS